MIRCTKLGGKWYGKEFEEFTETVMEDITTLVDEGSGVLIIYQKDDFNFIIGDEELEMVG